MNIKQDPYIEEIRQLDTRESKTKLAEYAATFGIELKKTRSFDNMLSDFDEEFSKKSDEPMPDSNEGISVGDLIQAADEADGTAIFDGEADENLKVLVDEIGNTQITDVQDVKIEDYESANTEEDNQISSDDIVSNERTEIDSCNMDAEFILDEKYCPRQALIGKAPGYITLPWWIYQWIKNNPNWKTRPTDFEHPTAHDTLFTLLYYIKRDGSVTVRETRDSTYVVLD